MSTSICSGNKGAEKQWRNETRTTCCMMIFIYERSSHKNAQFAYRKRVEGGRREFNNVVHIQ